jgi:hypothetical protein
MAAAAVPLVPGDVNPNDVIDYQDESNRKYYLNMTKELKNNFNLTELNLKSFLSEIDQRSTEAGWHSLFNIPEDVNVNNGPTIHLLTHYGQVRIRPFLACKAKRMSNDVHARAHAYRSKSRKYTMTCPG